MNHYYLFSLLVLFLFVSPANLHATPSKPTLEDLKPLMSDYFAALCDKTKQCKPDESSAPNECATFTKELVEKTFKELREADAVVTADHLQRAKKCTAEIRQSTCPEMEERRLPDSCHVWDSWDPKHGE